MSDDAHRELLRQVAAREGVSHNKSEAAMAQLYKALSGAVFAFVRQRLYGADDHAVQEVVVETMYEVWRVAGKFAGQSLVKTWVLGIARHKLLDAARRAPHAQAQAQFEDIDDHAETLADDNADITAQLAQQQRAQWLEYCMQRLPQDQRESLHLLLVEGLAIDAIAQLQDCPGGTIKTRVFHAKRKLKDCLLRWMKSDVPVSDLPAPT
jgi:RNA polymerase sigma-70 factor, ECF subfamily